MAGLVFFAVIGATVFATRRATRNPELPRLDDVGHRKLARAVTVATGITVLILFASFVHSLTTGRAIASLPAKSALTIHVTGVQWWWDVEYVDTVPSRRVVTATRSMCPRSSGADHRHGARCDPSFWVPNLHGKKDLIPGHTRPPGFRRIRPTYRGQCAEFCGHQHAKMALWVVANRASLSISGTRASSRPSSAD